MTGEFTSARLVFTPTGRIVVVLLYGEGGGDWSVIGW